MKISIADKLSYLRQRDHLTAEQIANRAKVPLSTLNKLLTGVTKNPSVYTMAQLAKLFDVPILYFLEEDTPVDCDIRLYSASKSICCASECEFQMIQRFRALPPNEQNTIVAILNELYSKLPYHPSKGNERLLLCYSAAVAGQYGRDADEIDYFHIRATLPPSLIKADYAVKVLGRSLEPIYPPGTLLAVCNQTAKHDQLGIFVYNNEGTVSRYYQKGDLTKLIAPSRDIPSIIVGENDSLRCVGTVLGAIRSYHRL